MSSPASLIEPEARDDNVTIAVKLKEIPHFVADLAQIAQIIVNLVRNNIAAIVKSDCQTRQVLLTTDYDDMIVTVSVTDSGSGLNSVINVFKPFGYQRSRRDGDGAFDLPPHHRVTWWTDMGRYQHGKRGKIPSLRYQHNRDDLYV